MMIITHSTSGLNLLTQQQQQLHFLLDHFRLIYFKLLCPNVSCGFTSLGARRAKFFTPQRIAVIQLAARDKRSIGPTLWATIKRRD